MDLRMRPALAALALAATGLVGCGVDNYGTVQLTRICFPPEPTASGCSYSANCNPVLASGHVWADLTYTQGTLVYPIEIMNQRLDNTDELRTNTNIALVERFDMRYLNASTGAFLAGASYSQSIKVETTSSSVALVELIPGAVGATLPLPANPAEILIMVKGHGHYLDGTTFDTAEFEVPASLQRGGYTPSACATAGQSLFACPQLGQSAVSKCLAP